MTRNEIEKLFRAGKISAGTARRFGIRATRSNFRRVGPYNRHDPAPDVMPGEDLAAAAPVGIVSMKDTAEGTG